MITLKKASIADIPTIREIAFKTWPNTYGEILSKEQLDYMLDKFYEPALLEESIHNGHIFTMAYEDDFCLGYAGYQHNYLDKNVTRLNKLYLLPESQGKGMGKVLIEAVEAAAKEKGSDIVTLNVNRFNKAASFYKKMGFEIVDEANIELDFGYLMEDFIMEKKVK
ncbi:GNAT family N-acetyltransferase [Flavobacterium sp. F-65]|uniref:GNAT family N-acetyltransferase n=1 Tax=Flavobacterium pisciphilum TaxID=2893755 RepID=A0ABS8MZI6_9FLAO|nr:GNAT family N-acetyltransferase [Flavobacterium sp. F-65]MCC9074199.1 GNAT family N-acetyltransferase [Flavobacterium sp. F-65]